MVELKELKKLEIKLFDGNFEEKDIALKKLIEINTIESHDIIKKALREGEEELKYFIKKNFSSLIQKDNFSESISKTVKEKDRKINLKNLKKYLNNPDSRKRLRAVEVAAKTGDMETLPLILELVENEQDDFVKATIAKNLGYFKDEKIIPVIARYLEDKDSRVRANAIEGLELLQSDKVIEIVTPLVRDSNNRVQANAAKLIAKFDINVVIDTFEKMIKSHAVWQRESALFALREIKNSLTIPMIIETIKNDSDENIKLTALRTLDVFSDTLVVEKLKELKDHPSVSSNPLIMEFINKKLRLDDEKVFNANPKPSMPNGIKYAVAFGFIFLFSIIIFGIIHFNNIKMELDSRISKSSLETVDKKSVNNNMITDNISKEEDKYTDVSKNNNVEILDDIETSIKKTDTVKAISIDKNTSGKENEVEKISHNDSLVFNDNIVKEKDLKEISDKKIKDSPEINSNKEIAQMNIQKIDSDELNFVSDIDSEDDKKIEKLEETEIIKTAPVSVDKLNDMLSKIESLKDKKEIEKNELNVVKDIKNVIDKEAISRPAENIRQNRIRRVVILPPDTYSVNRSFNIFSYGLLYSSIHVLEPLGAKYEFIDARSTIDTITKFNMNSNDIMNSHNMRDRLLKDLNADFIIQFQIRENGSNLKDYWDRYIIQDIYSSIESDLFEDSFLLAKVDPEIDLTDIDFFDENDLSVREDIARPFYDKAVSLYRQKRYSEAFNELKIVKAIVPDSSRYNQSIESGNIKSSYMIALSRDEENLLKKMRFSLDMNVFDRSFENTFSKKYFFNADEYYKFLTNIFNDLKKLWNTEGLIYETVNAVNGHSKDFKSLVYFYRALEYYYNENTDIQDLANRKNINSRYDKILEELNKSANASKEFNMVNILKSDILFRQNKNIEAMQSLKKAVENEPERLSLKYKMALLEEKNGNNQAAQNIYEEISTYKNATIYNNIRNEAIIKVSLNHFKNKEYEKALNRVLHGLRFDFNNSLYYIRIACEYKLGRFNEAYEDSKLLVRIEDNDVLLKMLEGDILYEINSKQKALENFKFVLENHDKEKSSQFYVLGITEINKGNIYLKIAKIYKSLNNLNLTESYLKQVISLDYYSPVAQEARKILDEMNIQY